jgi:hypothetical protein
MKGLKSLLRLEDRARLEQYADELDRRASALEQEVGPQHKAEGVAGGCPLQSVELFKFSTSLPSVDLAFGSAHETSRRSTPLNERLRACGDGREAR